MKERIEKKIDDIVNYILEKPVEKVTHEDYGILENKLRDIRFRENEHEQAKRMADLVASAFPNVGFGKIE